LKDGSETGVMDVLIEKWSGKKPQNLAPGINSFAINGKNAYESVTIKGKSTMSISVDAFDLNQDDLSYHFEIVPESTDTKAGGDFEKTPESVFKKIFVKSDPSIKAPLKKGKYRLFVVVKDKEKSATANIPFLVE
jgi:hypothetical protein